MLGAQIISSQHKRNPSDCIMRQVISSEKRQFCTHTSQFGKNRQRRFFLCFISPLSSYNFISQRRKSRLCKAHFINVLCAEISCSSRSLASRTQFNTTSSFQPSFRDKLDHSRIFSDQNSRKR